MANGRSHHLAELSRDTLLHADLIMSNGEKMALPKIYPLDAMFDEPADVDEETRTNKRYSGLDGYTISEAGLRCAHADSALH